MAMTYKQVCVTNCARRLECVRFIGAFDLANAHNTQKKSGAQAHAVQTLPRRSNLKTKKRTVARSPLNYEVGSARCADRTPQRGVPTF